MMRWTLRISLFLLLYSGGGVVTTVGVAWGCALLTPVVHHNPESWSGYEMNGGLWHTSYWKWCGKHLYATYSESVSDLRRPRRLRPDAIPPWVRRPPKQERHLTEHDDGYTVFQDMGCGWPFVAGAYAFDDVHGKRGPLHQETHWVLEVGHLTDGRSLPLKPIFPGFLVNTLFYAAIWFGIFFGVAALRRFIRKKRGRCVKCSYDLRGQFDKGCPECGWRRA